MTEDNPFSAVPEAVLEVLDRVSDAVYAVDRNWRFTYLNPAAAAFAQSDAQDLLGRVVWEEFPHLVDTEFQRIALRVMQDGVAQTHEDYLPAHDLWAEAKIYPSASGLTVLVRNQTPKKRALDQLRFQAAILDTIAEAVIVTSPVGTVEFWNSAAAKLYGWIDQEALGENILDLTPSTASALEALEIMNTLRKGGTWSGDFTVRRKDGTDFVAYVSNVPLIDESGELTGIAGVSRDVSVEREREAQARLALAEADTEHRRLAAILEASPVGIWIADATGRLTHSNPAALRIWGGSAPLSESIEGYGVYKAWWPESGQPVEPEEWALARTLKSGEIVVGEPMEIERFDGTRRFVLNSAAPIRDAAGHIVGGLVAMLDNTDYQAHAQERERLLSDLEHERNKLADIFSQAPVFIAVVRGGQHVIEFANEAYNQLIGFRQIIGMPLAVALPEVVEQGFVDLLDEAYRTGVPFRGDNQRLLVQRRPNAEPEECFVDFMYAPLKEREGSVSGILVMGIDVTERQRLETRLRQAQRMEAVGNLAGGISHDFNNLLTVIQNRCQFLLEEVRPDGPLTADILEIEKAADRAATLTKQLLAFSRRQLLQPKVLNVNAVVDSLKPMLDRLIGEHISISIKHAADLGSVKADEGQLEQVIMNLVVNARDAMPKGGRIHIESENAELEGTFDDEPGDGEPGPYVMLAISDTGTGMTPEVRAKIFEPFFTTKELGHGTGLGLSTVYGIIQQSAGRILVYTEWGHGTTFRIYLPRHAEAPDSAPTVPTDTIAGGTETVLLVEDESAVRSVVKRILQRGGYQVIDTESGAEAVVLAESTPSLRLVITDLVLPHMMGPEIWDAIAQKRPDATVLFMSGYTNDDVIRRGLLENEMRFLQKPFTATALLAAVRDALDSTDGGPKQDRPIDNR